MTEAPSPTVVAARDLVSAERFRDWAFRLQLQTPTALASAQYKAAEKAVLAARAKFDAMMMEGA